MKNNLIKNFYIAFKNRYILIFCTTYIIAITFLPVFSIEIKGTIIDFNGFKLIALNKILTQNSITIKNNIIQMIFIIKIVLNILFAYLYKMKKHFLCFIANIINLLTYFILIKQLKILKKQINEAIFPPNINISAWFLTITFFEILFLTYIFSILILKFKKNNSISETMFFICSILSFLIIIFILYYITINGLPAIRATGLFKFIFSLNWEPCKGLFGSFNLTAASILATIGSILLASFFGVITAIFLAEMAPKKFSNVIMGIIEVFSGIPSVIYGFFGMTVIVPLIKKTLKGFNKNNSFAITGDSLLAVILVLTIMITPTIISISYVSLKNVPKAFKEASLNLGATKTQTIFKINIKAAKTGIFSGITLAVAKAIGETMAVMMVAGNVSNFPHLLRPVKLLTTGIAIDMAYSSDLFRSALFGLGLILFILIVLINISFKQILKKNLYKFNTN